MKRYRYIIAYLRPNKETWCINCEEIFFGENGTRIWMDEFSGDEGLVCAHCGYTIVIACYERPSEAQ